MKELADFKVGDRTVRPLLGLIVKGDETVRVEPRSIDVLVALAERGRKVYPKKELIQAVWGETFVSDEVLTHAIWDLRKAFGDNASDPRYIQTIPKRGYRLIASVEAVEPNGGPRAEAQRQHRLLIWAALGLLVVFLALAAVRHPRNADTGGSLIPVGDPDKIALAVVASSAKHHDRELSERLAEDLSSELGGKPGLHPFKVQTCAHEAAAGGYCLEVWVVEVDGGHQARIELLRDGKIEWAPRKEALTAGSDLDRLLAQQVAAFFEAIQMPYYQNPDSRPWIDFSRHDTRAIVAFLKGMELVYKNEVGGRVLLDRAIEIDPDFIAPRLVRLPSLVVEGQVDAIARHLEHLHSLHAMASSFEKVMISFAEAHSRGAIKEEIRWLGAALESAKGHRPVTYVLASRLLDDGQLEEACEHLEALVASSWQYPPAYTQAVSCQIQLGQIEAAEATSLAALELDHVDPELLQMRVLLAIYDDDREAERIFRERLGKRVAQIAPEEFVFDSSVHQWRLAQLAEYAGREQVAQRLREFSY